LWQAEHAASLLRQAHAALNVELVPMSTKGDRIQDRSLAAIGGKGLFIKELETALEEGRADIAVHSMKDVPGDLPNGLMIGAVLPRADARDALIAAGLQRLRTCRRGRASEPRACDARHSCWRLVRICASRCCAAMWTRACGASTQANWMRSCWHAPA
jgi:hypothetical protein